MPLQHELVRALVAVGLAPHPVLIEMLDEHHSHRTERRGCGYTQATRYLAELVNTGQGAPRDGRGLFAGGTGIEDPQDRERRFAEAAQQLNLPESRLLLGMIEDLANPDRIMVSAFPVAASKLKVGSCPLAEQYFLEIAHERVRRGGRVHVWCDVLGTPRLIEKRGLGDEKSAISVDELRINGVRLPAGSLFALDYDDGMLEGVPECRRLPGLRLPIERLSGGRFLRLTTLAVEPRDRARAFSAHFQQQIDGGLFSPDTTRIAQLAALAQHMCQ